MGFFFGLIKWSVLAPIKLLKFIVADVLLFGIIGGTLSIVKSILKLLFKPLVFLTVAGGALLFFLSDEEKKSKIKALIGI